MREVRDERDCHVTRGSRESGGDDDGMTMPEMTPGWRARRRRWLETRLLREVRRREIVTLQEGGERVFYGVVITN